jgi:SNW domain-containing protein 1
MASLTALLPAPRHTYTVRDGDAAADEDTAMAPSAAAAAAPKKFVPPPYGRRAGFVPRTVEDFGDGGAFPEIHMQQFPRNMGRKEKKGTGAAAAGGAGAAGSGASTAVVPLSVNASGAVQYDAVVKRGHDARVVVHSGYEAMMEKNERAMDLSKPSAEEEERVAAETRAALGQIVDRKISTAMPTHVAKHSKEAVFIKYTPAEQNSAFNSGAQQRIIRLQEMPIDPLQPPKHKVGKLPPPPPDAPVPVMHSPPRKITKEDQEAWRIPPWSVTHARCSSAFPAALSSQGR